MDFSTPAFADGAEIPAKFTCDGEDVSPALAWSDVPEGAAELVLIIDDPDAPGGTFVHWVVYGISPGTDGADEGAVPPEAIQGTNDFDETRYRGPCPPAGDPHNYFFNLRAVSEPTGLGAGATAEAVVEAIGDTEMDRTQFIGSYGR